MENEHTLSGLMRKRQSMSNEIEAMNNSLRQLVIDLDHLDATIRLFDPDIDLETIKLRPLPPKHQAFKGEVTRVVLSTLRESKEPLTTKQLGQAVMRERGLDTNDAGTLAAIENKTITVAAATWEQVQRSPLARTRH